MAGRRPFFSEEEFPELKGVKVPVGRWAGGPVRAAEIERQIALVGRCLAALTLDVAKFRYDLAEITRRAARDTVGDGVDPEAFRGWWLAELARREWPEEVIGRDEVIGIVGGALDEGLGPTGGGG